LFGIPTTRQFDEWRRIKGAQAARKTRARGHRWLLQLAEEQFLAWRSAFPSLDEESAIEHLGLSSRFIDIADRYLSSRSPLTTAWTAKRNLQLALQNFEDDALAMHEYVKQWLTDHGVDPQAQARRIRNLEESWQ
jgi:hypothetical protein